MSTTQSAPANDAYAAFEQSQRMWRMWLDYATKMTCAGTSFDPDAEPSEAGKQVRSAIFQSMAQSTEQFMRSPQFLAMMRDWLGASINFRKQLNSFFTSAHHSTEGVAQQDIETLLLSLRHLETRLVEATD